MLPSVGRAPEAQAIAEHALRAGEARGQPSAVAYALDACGRAFAEADPMRASAAFREGLAVARAAGADRTAAIVARDLATFEVLHGEVGNSVSVFDELIDSAHRAGDLSLLGTMLAHVTVLFDRIGCAEAAATVQGACRHHPSSVTARNLPDVVDHLRQRAHRSRLR
jgi:hypothetical protein